MYILGGFNITLATCFNDVWSTEDGTNWTNISVDGAAGVWSTREGHCAVAANNGIYIYGGLDTVSVTYYNDVWFSSDGIKWTQLASAAPWTARHGASCFAFQNKTDCWRIDSGGTHSTMRGIRQMASTGPGNGGGIRRAVTHVFLRLSGQDVGDFGGTTGGGVTADVYNSSDGITWTLVTAAPFSPHVRSSCVPGRRMRCRTTSKPSGHGRRQRIGDAARGGAAI